MRKARASTNKPLGVHAIRSIIWIDEFAQINSRLAVRRKSHDFPFVAIRDEAKESCELRVEQSERIGPIQCKNVIQTSRLAAPDRSSLPSAAAVHNNHCCIVESRVRIRADGMGK